MSTSIDERVVRMRFDNQDFERKANSTIGVLEKLKQKLTFQGTSDAIKDVQKDVNSLSFDRFSKSADGLGSVLDTKVIAKLEVMRNLVSRVTDAGVKMVKSLSVDQVSSGFSKYEQKLANTQAIMNATKKPLNEVNAQLEKLMWYTDETSYSFSDMVNTIGRFTAYNIPLETAVTSIIGIANAAGLAGASVQDASHAMQGFAKGIGSAMDLGDWQWIETAHMDTAEFKKQLLESGVAMKKLAKVGEGTYKILGKAKDNIVTIESFRQSISSKWITGDVLTDTLGKFGQYSEAVYELTKEGVATADAMDALSGKFDEVGEAGMRASQESKTFGDAINAVKDAISTGWMRTFETLFGNFEEAKDVWAALYDELYDLFALSGDVRNELLEGWAGAGGRSILLETIGEAWGEIKAVLGVVKTAFDEIFPPATVDSLMRITRAFKEFVSQFKLSEDAMYSLKVIIKGLLLPLKLLQAVLVLGAKGLGKLAVGAFQVVNVLLTMLANTEFARQQFQKLFGEVQGARIFDSLCQIFENVGVAIDTLKAKLSDFSFDFFGETDIIESAKKALKDFGDYAIKLFADLLEGLATGDWTAFFNTLNEGFGGITDVISEVIEYIQKAAESLGEFLGIDIPEFKGFEGFLETIKNFFTDSEGFKGTMDQIKTGALDLWAVLEQLANKIVEFCSKVSPAEILIAGVGLSIITLIFQIANFVGSLSEATKGFKAFTKSAGAMFDAIKQRIDPTYKRLKTAGDSAVKIGAAFILLASALTAISRIPADDLRNAADAIFKLVLTVSIASGAMMGLSILGEKLGTKFTGLDTVTKTILALSVAMVAFAGAMKLMDGVEVDSKMITSWAMAMTSLVIVAGAIGFLASKENKFEKGVGLILSMAAAFFVIVETINRINPDKVAPGIMALISMCGALVILFAAASVLSEPASKAVRSLGKVAIGLALLLGVIELIGFCVNKSPDALGSGLMGMIVIFGILGTFLSIVGHFGVWADEATKGIGRIARALTLLMIPILVLGNTPVGVLAKGIITLGIIMAAYGAIITAFNWLNTKLDNANYDLPKNLLQMAGAIDLLVLAVAALGYLDTDAVKQGVKAVGALMIIMGLMIKIGKPAGDAKVAMTGLAAAIAAFAIAVAVLSFVAKYNQEWFIAASVTMILGMVAIAIALKALEKQGKGIKGVIKVIGLMAAAFAAMWVVCELLKDFDGKDVLAKSAALSLVLVALASSVRIMSGKDKQGVKTDELKMANVNVLELVKFVGVAALALIAVGNFGGTNSEQVLSNALGLSAILLAMSASVAIMNDTKWDHDLNVKGGWMLGFCATAGATLIAVGRWGSQNTDVIKANAGALSVVILALSAAVRIMNKTDFNMGLGQAAVLALLVAGISAAMLILAEVKTDGMFEKAMALVTILGGLTLVVEVLSHFKVDPAAVMQGLVAIGEVLIGVTVVLAVVLAAAIVIGTIINAIDKAFAEANKASLKETIINGINTSIEIVGTLIAGIGTIAGMVVDAFQKESTKSLDIVAQRISDFATNLQTAINIFGGIEDGNKLISQFLWVATAVKQLLEISYDAGAPSHSMLPDIAASIKTFADDFKEFSTKMADAYSEDAIASINAFKTVAETLVLIPNDPKKLGDLEGFMKKAQAAAPDIVAFAEALSSDKVNATSVEAAINAAKTVAGFARELSAGDSMKLESTMTTFGSGTAGTDGPLTRFAKELTNFGEPLMTFSSTVSGVSKADVENAINAAKIVNSFAKELPKENGFVDMWAGETKSLSTFGTEIKDFGYQLVYFSAYAQKVDKDKVEDAADAASYIMDAYKNLPTSGGWLDHILKGEKMDLSAFSSSLADLAAGLAEFDGTGVANVAPSVDAANLLIGLSNNLANFDSYNLQLFSEAIRSYANVGITDFAKMFTDHETEIKNGSKVFTDMAIAGLNAQIDNLKTAINDMTSAMISCFAAAATDSKLTTAGNDVGKAFATAVTDSTLYSSIGSTVVGYITNGITLAIPSLKTKVEELLDTVSQAFESVDSTSLTTSKYYTRFYNIGKNMIDALINAFGDNMDRVKSAAEEVFKTLVKPFNNIKKDGTGIGKNFLKGLVAGLTNRSELRGVSNAAAAAAQTLLATLMKKLGIHSPSTVGMWIGEMLMKGIGIGEKKDKTAENEADNKVKRIIETIQNGGEEALKGFDFSEIVRRLIAGEGPDMFKEGKAAFEEYVSGAKEGLSDLSSIFIEAVKSIPKYGMDFIVNKTGTNVASKPEIDAKTLEYTSKMVSTFDDYLSSNDTTTKLLKKLKRDALDMSDGEVANMKAAIDTIPASRMLQQFRATSSTIYGIHMMAADETEEHNDRLRQIANSLIEQTKITEQAKTDYINTVAQYGKDSEQATKAFTEYAGQRGKQNELEKTLNAYNQTAYGKYDEFAWTFLEEIDKIEASYADKATEGYSEGLKQLMETMQSDMDLYYAAVETGGDAVLDIIDALRADMADGIINDTQIVDAIREKMSEILGVFSDLQDQFDLKFSIDEADYKLWEATEGLNASEEEKLTKQKQLQEKELASAANKVRLAEMAYEKAVQLTGASSVEAQQAKLELKNLQIEFAEMAKQYNVIIEQIKLASQEAEEAAVDLTKTPYELAMEELEEWKKDGSFKEWTDFGATEQELIDALIDKYERKQKEQQEKDAKTEAKKTAEENVRFEAVQDTMNQFLDEVNIDSLDTMVHNNMMDLVKAWAVIAAKERQENQNGGYSGGTGGYTGGTGSYTGTTGSGDGDGSKGTVHYKDQAKATIKLINKLDGTTKELEMSRLAIQEMELGNSFNNPNWTTASGWRINMTRDEYLAAWEDADLKYAHRNAKILNGTNVYETFLSDEGMMMGLEEGLAELEATFPALKVILEKLEKAENDPNVKIHYGKIGFNNFKGNYNEGIYDTWMDQEEYLRDIAGLTEDEIELFKQVLGKTYHSGGTKYERTSHQESGVTVGWAYDQHAMTDIVEQILQMGDAKRLTKEEVELAELNSETLNSMGGDMKITYQYGTSPGTPNATLSREIYMMGPDGYWYKVPMAKFRQYLKQGWKYYQDENDYLVQNYREFPDEQAYVTMGRVQEALDKDPSIDQSKIDWHDLFEDVKSNLPTEEIDGKTYYDPIRDPKVIEQLISGFREGAEDATYKGSYGGTTAGLSAWSDTIGNTAVPDYSNFDWKQMAQEMGISGGDFVSGMQDYWKDSFMGDLEQIFDTGRQVVDDFMKDPKGTWENWQAGAYNLAKDKAGSAEKSAKEWADKWTGSYESEVEYHYGPRILSSMTEVFSDEVSATEAGRRYAMMAMQAAIEEVNRYKASGLGGFTGLTPVKTMDSYSGLKTSISTEQIYAITKAVTEKAKEVSEATKRATSSVTPVVNNFTQNNYSPKSLSRYDIYRDTRNQLARIRRVTSVR